MAFQPPKAFTGRHHRRDLWHHRGSQLWVWSPCWGSLWGDGKIMENREKTCRGWGGNSTFAALYLPRLEVKGQRWWLRVIFQWESILPKFQWHPTNGVKFLPVCNVLVVREGTVWISKQLTYVDCLFVLLLCLTRSPNWMNRNAVLTVQWFGIFSLMFARVDTSMTCSY